MNLDKEKYLSDLTLKVEEAKKSKVNFEFQELGVELEAVFGKEHKSSIWALFYRVGMTEDKVRRALAEFRKRKFSYFLWILNKVIK